MIFRLEAVRHADTIIAMEAGRVVETERHHDLTIRHWLYARLN